MPICEFNSEFTLLPTNPNSTEGADEGFRCEGYQLQYQNDGNLVYYENVEGQKQRKTIVASGTQQDAKALKSWALMDKSGCLMIVNENGTVPYWKTKNYGPEGANLYIDSDSGELFYAASADDKRIPVDLANGIYIKK